jgi:hypothetical protein
VKKKEKGQIGIENEWNEKVSSIFQSTGVIAILKAWEGSSVEGREATRHWQYFGHKRQLESESSEFEASKWLIVKMWNDESLSENCQKEMKGRNGQKRKVKKLENAGKSTDGNAKANPFDHPKPSGKLPNCLKVYSRDSWHGTPFRDWVVLLN